MVELDKLLYEEEKWKKIATALEEVNEAHKYDDKYEKADQLFEDSKSEITSKDVDGAISFKTKTYQPEAKPIREDYSKLYDYAKNIGKIIDEKVDTPFYKSIDGYIQKMADLTISSYSTANTINVKEGFLFKHEKDSITIDDLYNTDTTYSQNLKTEFENWKLQNQNQDVSEEDYRTAALNTGAFEYEGIRAGQEKNEFWFNLVSAGLIIGLTIVCPPAGLVAGGIYTAIDVAGAVKGEDLISGRKLSDDERIMRGVFSVVPAAGGLAAKTILRNVPALANVLKTASKTVDDSIKPIKNTVARAISTAKKLSAGASKQLNYMLKHPLNAMITSKAGQETVRKTSRFLDDALRPVKVRTMQTVTGDNVFAGIERVASDGKLENTADQFLAAKQAEKERRLGEKSTGNVKIHLGTEDLNALRNRWNVPETNTIAIGKTDVKGLEDLTFEGGSPEVRKEAGLPSLDTILPNREIKAPYDHIKNPKLAQFTRHAEEGVLNEFDSAVKKAEIEPTKVTGILRIHQSNPRGVCNKCSKGLLKPYPIEKSGIFYQASKKYPNLIIEVTSEIDESVKTNGLLSFNLKDGKIIK